REDVPLDWASTQMNLGNALSTLGERESGTERLEQAVDAYRAALEESTRERVPLQWAMTQNNLGNALADLGERRQKRAELEAALMAMKGAVDVYLNEALQTHHERYFKERIEEIEASLAELDRK
ncbi:MAG: tetratricopeptide repeat protein, partial [Alphaproteobacteria bacterium GM202ARS2]|nr:tetratricopeptide repeat protein [Alphaproteobacteria bacterium GM202ARS2]